MPWLLVVICWLALGPFLKADDTRLIRAGAVWKYFKGTQEPAGAFGAWRFSEYDDSTWPESMSGWSTSAYVPEPGYFIDYGVSYRTVYVRKRFVAQAPETIRELTLRVDYDDGFIAYLNGLEVARRGMVGETNEPVAVSSIAAYHARGNFEEIDLSASIPLLKRGENTLAVQVFGSGLFDYTFAFVPELLGNFTRGPLIQNTTSNSTQIIFKTLNPAVGFIELTNAFRISLPGTTTNHVATLTNLVPDTEYTYRAVAILNGAEVATDWHSFRTFKTTGSVSFAVLGDSGSGSLAQYQVAAQMKAAAPDLVMHVGDLIYYAINNSSADFRLLSVYADQLFSTPMFVAFGNHDFYGSSTAALETFYLPTNNFTGSELFYSFDHGDVHFAVIWTDLQAYADYRPGSPQYRWLDADLASTTKPWKFLFFHHVWRSSGPHGDDDYDLNKVPDWQQMEEGPIALARKHGVQVVFNGHDHDYERFTPSGGVLSIVSGGGGTVIYAPERFHPDSVEYLLQHEFVKVDVEGDVAVLQAVGVDGQIFDRVHVQRTSPAKKLRKAVWNRPGFAEESFAEDNDEFGSFQLAEPALGGRFGQYSSTGRLFVNNDNRNLYVGFDEVMLHAGDELFLFLEPSGGSRTNDLIDLDSLIASASGLTNSLLTLSGLSFTNFNPSVGLVLGDEYGDGGFTLFVRTGRTNNSGQGAFFLTHDLPLVPGQKVSQLNRSPDAPSLFERNANFVQVALPLNALNLHPGDHLRLAAVVALSTSSSNSAGVLVRDLDATLGASAIQESDRLYLEPFEFQLEADLDPDNDGLTDAQEATLGTDPARSDSDADGLPDGWEVAHGFNPLLADGETDPDGDGMSNRAEFVAGTDPRNSGSRLRADAIDRNGFLELRWHAVPGRRYNLQIREDLTDPFREMTDASVPALPLVARRSIESVRLNMAPGRNSQYYRIVVLPE